MNLPTDQIALAGGKASQIEKALLYKHHPRWRQIFMGLPDNKLHLLKKLDASLSRELLRYHDYSALKCGIEHLRSITEALGLFPAAEAMQVFQQKLKPSIRDAVLKDLTPGSRAMVEAQLVGSDDPAHSAEITRVDDLGVQTSNQDAGAKPILHFRNRLPRELWENILGFTSPWITGLMYYELGIAPLKEERFDLIWYQIFRNENWLDYMTTSGAHPGLLFKTESSCDRHTTELVVLLLHKQGNAPAAGSPIGIEWRDRFFESFRGKSVEAREHEFEVGKITLNVRAIFHDNLWVESLSFMHAGLASYCYWTDTQRKLTTIETHHFGHTYRGRVLDLDLPFVDSRPKEEAIPRFDVVPDSQLPDTRRKNRNVSSNNLE